MRFYPVRGERPLLPRLRARTRGDECAGGERPLERVRRGRAPRPRGLARPLRRYARRRGRARRSHRRGARDARGPRAARRLGHRGLSAVGFAAQTSFTLESYRGVRLEELAAAETDDPRFWWRRRSA